MLINFVGATNDANHYSKPPPGEHKPCSLKIGLALKVRGERSTLYVKEMYRVGLNKSF